MRVSSRWRSGGIGAGASLVLALFTPAPARSATSVASVASVASAKGSASAAPSSATAAPKIAPTGSVPLPSGHPSLDGPPVVAGPLPAGDTALPQGHPTVGAPEAAPPPNAELPEIPQDLAQDDSRIAPGTIEVRIVDDRGQPVKSVPVTLGILRTSVAQGELRTRKSAETDSEGDVRFEGLQAGSGWAYRVSVENVSADGSATAKYAAAPFSLPLDRGYRLLIHRYPVTTSLDGLMVAVGAVDTGIEVRDDVVEVQQTYEVINAGLVTWGLGRGISMTLPKGAKGLRSPESMQDLTIVGMEGDSPSVRWQGSFAPGDAQVSYDFKVPYDGAAGVDLDLELPQRVLAARVRLAARRDMTLAVDGFPAAALDPSTSGVHVLQATRRGDPKDQIRSLHIHVGGLPTQGPDRWIAIGLGLAAVAAGAVFSLREPGRAPDPKEAAAARARRRAALIDEMSELERAHASGAVGPRGYARERLRLIDALADVLDPPVAEDKPARKSKTKGEPRAVGKRAREPS